MSSTVDAILRRAVEGDRLTADDGKLGYKTLKTIARDHTDTYAPECKL